MWIDKIKFSGIVEPVEYGSSTVFQTDPRCVNTGMKTPTLVSLNTDRGFLIPKDIPVLKHLGFFFWCSTLLGSIGLPSGLLKGRKFLVRMHDMKCSPHSHVINVLTSLYNRCKEDFRGIGQGAKTQVISVCGSAIERAKTESFKRSNQRLKVVGNTDTTSYATPRSKTCSLWTGESSMVKKPFSRAIATQPRIQYA